MLSRRRFLASLAASVGLHRAIPSSRSDLSAAIPTLDEPWSYSQAHSLAVRANTRVLELPLPQLPWTPPVLPAFDPVKTGATLRRRFPALQQHFVFEYYPWYSADPWRHWNLWQRVPPFDIAATSVPRLGLYDSRDAKVVEQHARWIRDAGVGSINLSWWGRGSFEDQRVPLVMDVMRDHGLKVTFHLEPYDRQRTERYADDIKYLLTEYGAKRRWDCFLMLDDADGVEGPVFKSFATILPPQGTDCHGRTFSVDLYRPDSLWRQQTDTVRDTFRHDFDQILLLADSSALDRLRAGGFDGMALFDNYVRPEQWPGMAVQCRKFDVEFSFNINAGFDGIAQRNVPPDSCYRPPRFEPPAMLDWSTARDREQARQLAEWRIDQSMRTTLNLQTDRFLPPAKTGFFLTYINSFNEWHEGTQFEPMKDAAMLSPEEARFGYHNAIDGGYRMAFLKSRLQPILAPQ
jgi:Glycosyl hydrolase family 99